MSQTDAVFDSPNPQARDRLLPLQRVAERLGVKRRTVNQMIHDGRLPAVNVSQGKKRSTWRVKRGDVEDFIAGARVEGGV
jgi:excisionase family DNA binding protein